MNKQDKFFYCNMVSVLSSLGIVYNVFSTKNINISIACGLAIMGSFLARGIIEAIYASKEK